MARGVATTGNAPGSGSASAAARSAPETGSVVMLAQDSRGHFMAQPQINGVRLSMLVDTGASTVALSAEDASRAGYFPSANDFRVSVSTANGVIKAAPVRIREMQIDRIRLQDVDALVMPSGRLQTSLLGMSFLKRLSSFTVNSGTLVLRQ
ncbi:retropepsin-like aspartic protease family protein [Alsobacter sp. R-9]